MKDFAVHDPNQELRFKAHEVVDAFSNCAITGPTMNRSTNILFAENVEKQKVNQVRIGIGAIRTASVYYA